MRPHDQATAGGGHSRARGFDVFSPGSVSTSTQRLIFVMQAAEQFPEPSALISVKQTAHLCGIHRRTLEREVDRKKFPPPVKIGSKSLYFRKDIETYLRKLNEERGTTS